jgi:UDP-N-acetylglucosamine 2-epimerase (non-hydrolysing)
MNSVSLRKIMVLFGTRPEAIKMAPVVQAIAGDKAFQCQVCVTGQHRQMLDQVLVLFAIAPDYDLDIMQHNQDLGDITSRVLLGMRGVLEQARPDLLLVQGDTTTCFAGALAGFYAGIPVGHVEAGLRTGNLAAPFPEEANRQLTSRLAKLHFAPTTRARKNLLDEGIGEDRIVVTGNTVIDALLSVRQFAAKGRDFQQFGTAAKVIKDHQPYVLITGHRRENFGGGFTNICAAIATLARRHPLVHFVYPVHLNPQVQQPVHAMLGGLCNVHLIAPLEYGPFVMAMDRCRLILTDSGGVQEEAPSLGKPVLVMREITERPEAVEAGTVVLVGTNQAEIVTECERILAAGQEEGADRNNIVNPYGDGRAAERIVTALHHFFAGEAI